VSAITSKSLRVSAALALLVVAGGASAAQRAFVSTSGVDNPNCSLASPCRTLGAALTAVAAGGEIIVLDSGGYGAVAIGKPVTIESAAGVYAGMTVTSGDGIAIAAGPSDRIVLRGLTINGQGGTNGIHIQQAGVVHVERCTINGLAVGIFFEPATPARLVVADSVVRNNTGRGIYAAPVGAGATSRVEVTRSEISHNGSDGIILVDVERASVTETLSANNQGAGIWFASTALSLSPVRAAVDRAQLVGNLAGVVATSTTLFAAMTLTNSVIANTAGIGVIAQDKSLIDLAGNQISGNDTGTQVFGTGIIESIGTNIRVNNPVPGSPALQIQSY
jgi:hypothetical protein